MIYGGHFDPENKQKKLEKLDKVMKEDNFWTDRRKAEQTINEFNQIKSTLDKAKKIKEDVEFHIENLNAGSEEALQFSQEEYPKISKDLENIEIEVLLNGKYDHNDAVLEIHSGAGGTEACDWANMLYRMYSKWILKQGYKEEIVDKQPGLEAGIKSITIIVSGANAYGYLKNEKGIHRLVRISPFDSGARRHTSFASISVTPVVDDKVDIEINQNDLKIDVFHSSGAGGQSVNTTDSAVRITHLPTGVVVTCQNERSQVQNKEKAMQILRSKLFEMMTEVKKQEIKELKGEQKDINFGSQIRSYVMHPYSLVKDHRTNTEETNVGKVLDGEIDAFINSNLRRNANDI